MTEPQCYHGDVNSRLKKMHSTCVSNQMWSDMFVSKTWASCHTSLNSMLKNIVNAISAQGRAASIGGRLSMRDIVGRNPVPQTMFAECGLSRTTEEPLAPFVPCP